MADPKHPRHFTDDFKRLFASPCNAGRPPSEIMREYDLGSTTLRRWIDSVNAAGSPRSVDNRTSEQGRIIEPGREDKRLRTEAGVPNQEAPMVARKWRRWRLTPTATRHRRGVRSSACRPRPAAVPARVEPDVLAVHAESEGGHGARKVKAPPGRRGVVASRRRISRIMGEDGLSSAYGRKRFRARPGKPNGAEPPSVLDRPFDGCAPRAHACSDLAYVRAGGSRCHVRLPVDPCNGEVAGRSAGSGKGAKLVKAAFATPGLPTSGIEVFHTDRGGESGNAEIGLMLGAFGIERLLSAKGCPYDNAVDESTNKIPKAEPVYRDGFSDLRDLQAKLSDYVHRHNDFRIHSTLGYMGPVGFRKAGLILSKPSK